MAINKCDPCEAKNCVGFIEDEMFKKWMVELLCTLIANGSASAPADLQADAITIPFGTLSNVQTLAGLTLVSLVRLGITNNTNAVIKIDYTLVKNGPIINPGETVVVDLGANGGRIDTPDVFISYVGSAPTLGSVALDALYRTDM